MAEPVNPDPTDDSSQEPSVPVKKPVSEPPMNPNPYMGGGMPPA